MTTLLILSLVSYLIGAIPTGVILTRLSGADDIRTAGSGNIGATNVYRVAGRGLGVLTLLGDALKGAVPVLIVQKLMAMDPLTVSIVALAAFLGHCFPVYLKFKGGKGVATALGIFLVLSPKAILIAFALFVVVLYLWRYISLASMSAASSMPFLVLFFTNLSYEKAAAQFLATLVIAALIIWRHKANIVRLRQGNENKFNL